MPRGWEWWERDEVRDEAFAASEVVEDVPVKRSMRWLDESEYDPTQLTRGQEFWHPEENL